MNDNIPAGSANDPRAPWNQTDTRDTNEYEELESAIRSDLSDILPDTLWDLITEHTTGQLRDTLYEELYDEIRKLWERRNNY